MSVVLRCPNCGTTRATPGDCEACHEGTVRYFCTSHTPGIWVDEPTCPRCGARFGEVRRPRTPPPPARTPPPAPTRIPAPTRVPSADPWAGPSPKDERDDGDRLPPVTEVRLPPAGSPLRYWLDLVTAASRARGPATVPAPERAGPGIARGVFGCLVQLVILFISLVLGGVLLFNY